MSACILPVYTLPQLCARGWAELGSHKQLQEKHWQVLRQTDGTKCVGFCLLITRTLKPGLTEVYLKRECQAGEVITCLSGTVPVNNNNKRCLSYSVLFKGHRAR